MINRYPFEELDSDAFSKFYKHKDLILEWIYVQDQREVIYLLGAFEKIIKLQLSNVVEYLEIQYNEKEKVVEVLRKYYPTKLLDLKPNHKQLVEITQQLFQTLATLEGYQIYVLNIKPSNIFYDGKIIIGGLVRSDKFLQSQPFYQQQSLRDFVKEFMITQQYNITLKYQQCSRAVCFSAIVILIQCMLQIEPEQLTNIVKWLDQEDEKLVSIPSSQSILDKIETKYQAMRIFIEQANMLLLEELFEPSNELSIKLMSMASELRYDNNLIIIGGLANFKQIEQPKPMIIQDKPIIVQPIPQVQQKVKQKRTGGGFILPTKKK